MKKAIKYKALFACADGSYDPKQIASFINKHVFNGQASADTLQDAYVKVMVWLEDKKLPFSEKSISDNKDELKVIINDPNYLKDKEEQKPSILVAFILAGIVFAIWWLCKDDPISIPDITHNPMTPAPAPAPPSPAPPPTPVPPAPPVPPANQ